MNKNSYYNLPHKGWTSIDLRKEDIGKLFVLQTIFENSEITRYQVSQITKHSKKKIHSDVAFWESIGAVVGEQVEGDRRRSIHYFMTDIGIIILYRYGVISKKEIERLLPSHHSIFNEVKYGDEIQQFPTPIEIGEVSKVVVELMSTVFPGSKDIIAGYDGAIPLSEHTALITDNYTKAYSARRTSAMMVILAGLHLHLQNIRHHLEYSKEFRNVYRKICTILDKKYNLNR